MKMVYNPFGQDPGEFSEEDSAYRIGKRIRNIRNARKMSLVELGEAVGLSADRMQKYENGARQPRPDMLKKIADALGVSVLALTDPVTDSYIGVMYAMFELENIFNMKIKDTSIDMDRAPELSLTVDNKERLYDYMKEWFDIYRETQSELKAAKNDEEREKIVSSYHNWQWNFPKGIADRTEIELRKMRLKMKIDELQAEYDMLDQKK